MAAFEFVLTKIMLLIFLTLAVVCLCPSLFLIWANKDEFCLRNLPKNYNDGLLAVDVTDGKILKSQIKSAP